MKLRLRLRVRLRETSTRADSDTQTRTQPCRRHASTRARKRDHSHARTHVCTHPRTQGTALTESMTRAAFKYMWARQLANWQEIRMPRNGRYGLRLDSQPVA
eukprot:6344936-Alexandrium_andersonii.AAC.1